jgi:glycosyltransferase involved in cell wall biosynthesis
MFMPEEWLTFRAARRHDLLINGGTLTRIFGHRHSRPVTVISSTLDDGDFHARADTCVNGEVVVLYAGFLRHEKRLETLIEAIAMLIRDGRSVRLRIVGSAEPPLYAELLRSQVRAAGLDAKVEFTGFIPLGDPLNNEYRSADIYVLPSASEGSARTLLEAASQSLPCVTTDVGGVRDVFIDGESALIVPPNDAAAMARAIARYIDEPELRRRCICNAYETAGRHTCRAFIQQIMEHLKKAHRHAGAKGNAKT